MKFADIFLTLQGESYHSGKPTIFIRTAFCPIRCSWCDTGFADKDWIKAEYEFTPSGVLTFIERQMWRTSLVCLTGGEPLLESETPQLLTELALDDFKTGVETSGVVKLVPYLKHLSSFTLDKTSFVVDIKTPSSLQEAKNRYEDWSYLRKGQDQLKAVIADRKDYEFVREVLKKHNPKVEVLLSPMCSDDGKRFDSAKQLARWILEDQLNVRMQMQLHKIAEIK